MTVNEAINSCDLGGERKILAWIPVSLKVDYVAGAGLSSLRKLASRCLSTSGKEGARAHGAPATLSQADKHVVDLESEHDKIEHGWTLRSFEGLPKCCAIPETYREASRDRKHAPASS